MEIGRIEAIAGVFVSGRYLEMYHADLKPALEA